MHVIFATILNDLNRNVRAQKRNRKPWSTVVHRLHITSDPSRPVAAIKKTHRTGSGGGASFFRFFALFFFERSFPSARFLCESHKSHKSDLTFPNNLFGGLTNVALSSSFSLASARHCRHGAVCKKRARSDRRQNHDEGQTYHGNKLPFTFELLHRNGFRKR